MMQTQENLPEIRKKIVLNAPIEKVWKAVSSSEGIAAWWMPNSLEPVLGNEFVLHTGQFGDSPCKVTELESPYRFGFDWGKDWHLLIELQKLYDKKTELTLVHSGWDADKTTEFGQSHTAIYQFMDGGWEKIIKEKLPSYIGAYM